MLRQALCLALAILVCLVVPASAAAVDGASLVSQQSSIGATAHASASGESDSESLSGTTGTVSAHANVPGAFGFGEGQQETDVTENNGSLEISTESDMDTKANGQSGGGSGSGTGSSVLDVQFQVTGVPVNFTISGGFVDTPHGGSSVSLTCGGTVSFQANSESQSGFGTSGRISPGTCVLHVAGNSSTSSDNDDDSEEDGSVHVDFQAVPACVGSIQVGLTQARGCFVERGATGVFETVDEAWVGGFHLRPMPGGKLVLQNSPNAPLAAEGAGVEWLLGPLAVPAPLAELQPFVPDFTLGLNTAGSIERFVQLPFLQGLSAQLKVTWDSPGGAGAKVEASVSMEELTKNLGKPLAGALGLGGTSVGTLAAKLGLQLKNGVPAEVTDGELQVPEFAVELKGTNPPIKEGFGGAIFKGKRIGASVEWSGEVTVLFPWQGDSGTNQGVVTGRLFFLDAEIAGLGLAVSGFEKPIGRSGWDLTGVGGDVIYRPSLAFNVGVTAQQRSSFAGVKLFKLTGNVKGLALAASDCSNGSNPYEFVGTFNSPSLEAQDLGELKGQVLMCAYMQGTRNFAFEAGLSGELNITVAGVEKVFTVQGSARGWFSGTDFNLDGSYQLKLPGIPQIRADGVFSSAGYAFCGRFGFLLVGFGTDNWLQTPQELLPCDFTPFRVATSPSSALRPLATGAKNVRIPAGQTAFGAAVRGTGGAPRVRVVGPKGEQFVSPAGAVPLKTSAAVIISVDQLNTTYVYLRKPRAGTWRIEPLDPAVSIARIETARQLPQPRVRARVKLKGGKVLLDWTATKVPGQRIELVERADGVATTIQKLTSKRKGRVRFTPQNPLETRRTIEAVLLQDGSPRPPLTVARYKLKTLKRPGAVGKPTAKRTAQGLAIRWLKAARAKDYLVTVEEGATVVTRTSTKRLKLTVAQPPAGQLTVRLTARDTFGRPGPTAVLNVAP